LPTVIDHGDGVKAIGDVPRRIASERAALESAEGLVAQVIEVQIGNQALDGKRELRVLRARVDTVGNADQGDLAVLQLLEDLRRVGEVARDPRHVFGDDGLDPATLDGCHHRLEAWAVQAGAGHSEVREDLGGVGVAALLGDVLAASAHLILNAAFVLQR
jgi:hypothetical protein